MSFHSKPPSKGPPPLPAIGAPIATPSLGDLVDAEGAFFLEGVDGHAESLPSNEATEETRHALALVDAESIEEQLPVEDPVRARRRRAARIGVAWGAVAMVALAGVGSFVGHRVHHGLAVVPDVSTVSVSPPPAEPVASAPVAAPAVEAPAVEAPLSPAEPLPPIAQPPPRPPVHATVASATAAAPPSPRGAARKGSASRTTKAAPASARTVAHGKPAHPAASKSAASSKDPHHKTTKGTAKKPA